VFAYFRGRIRRLENERARQQGFSRQILESQEAERKRIAGELHDSLGQNLLIIKARATLCGKEPELAAPLKEHLEEISTTSMRAIEEVRTIAHALRPHHLDRFGLSKSLQAMVRQISEVACIKIESEIGPLENLFTAAEEMNLYRIVQESLNNIVKHSGARLARIRIQHESNRIRILIQDDGRGFSPGLSTGPGLTQGGFGLTSIGERARMLGGLCRIDSAPGCGTRLEIEFTVAAFRDE